MRAVVQRVAGASVAVEGREIARIDRGFLVLIGFHRDDDESQLAWMARKIASLRVFEDPATGRMSLGLDAVNGSVLVVSQFTLYGNVGKGTRPSFDASAAPDVARDLYDRFVAAMEECLPGRVAGGEFQAHMQVALVNDGPVTLVIDRGGAA